MRRLLRCRLSPTRRCATHCSNTLLHVCRRIAARARAARIAAAVASLRQIPPLLRLRRLGITSLAPPQLYTIGILVANGGNTWWDKTHDSA